MATYEQMSRAIDQQLKREDLTAEDLLFLVIARRLNACSDSDFTKTLGGCLSDTPIPLNFWGKR